MSDIEVCHCNGIMKSEIIKAIKEQNLKTLEEVQNATTAGTVCGGCVDDIEDILAEVNS